MFEDAWDDNNIDRGLNANILYRLGVVKGEEVNGLSYYRPEREISRAEMGAMTYRVMQYKKWRDIANSTGSSSGSIGGGLKPIEGVEDIILIEGESVTE